MNRNFEERTNYYPPKDDDPTPTEIDFESPCPVQQCINNDKLIKWSHRNCGGHEKLTDKGELRCIKCGTKGRFVDWRFNCGDHDYLKASSQGVCHALSIMAQLSIKPNEQSFISTTCAVIMQQFVDKIENNE